MLYVSMSVGKSEKPAISKRPAKSIRGTPFEKCSAAAVATAVPRLWPSSTILSGGIFATVRAQLTVATASIMIPSSVGEPVEYPKPR
jgi:hypothetical protein